MLITRNKRRKKYAARAGSAQLLRARTGPGRGLK